MRCFKPVLLTIVVMLFVVARGGNDANALGAAPNLGVVTNATVNFFASDGTTLLGTGDTGADGIVTIDVGTYRGPVVVVVEGDDDAAYFDEAAGTLVPFPAGSQMFALTCSRVKTIAVTPLTDIAYVQAVTEGLFPLSCCEVNALNEIVRSSLAPGLKSILSVPTPFDENTTAGSLTASEAGHYALVLAALKRLGASAPAPGLEVLGSLRQDAADGVIDSDFIAALQAAIIDVAADFGNSSLQAIADQLGPVDINVDGGHVASRCAGGAPVQSPQPPVTGGTGGTDTGGGGF
jgi:hypothetical protein